MHSPLLQQNWSGHRNKYCSSCFSRRAGLRCGRCPVIPSRPVLPCLCTQDLVSTMRHSQAPLCPFLRQSCSLRKTQRHSKGLQWDSHVQKVGTTHFYVLNALCISLQESAECLVPKWQMTHTTPSIPKVGGTSMSCPRFDLPNLHVMVCVIAYAWCAQCMPDQIGLIRQVTSGQGP